MSLPVELRELGRTGEKIPVIGIGTWGMGGYSWPDYSEDKKVIEAIRYAIELGMTHIDTAEMYARGHTEELVGEAIRGYPRDELFIATKVWYTNLRYDDVIKACERSLKRLGLSYVDLYMVHWSNPAVPISETMRAMEKLLNEGKVRYIGVSNFSVNEIEEAEESLSKSYVVANQVSYSLHDRSIEADLLDYCERRKIAIVAHTPLGRGSVIRELKDPSSKRGQVLREVAKRIGKTPVQVALNWVIWREHVLTIPKAIEKPHIYENASAAGWRLSEEYYTYISKAWSFKSP